MIDRISDGSACYLNFLLIWTRRSALAEEAKMSLAATLDKGVVGRSEMGVPLKGTREKGFAKRLKSVLDKHPDCPKRYGRLMWVTRMLAHENVDVSNETIRRWLAGTMMPRRLTMRALAKTLRVDETWLAMGTEPLTPAMTSDRLGELEDALREIAEITDNEEIKRIIGDVMGGNDD